MSFDKQPVRRPAITAFHVLWLTVSVGLASLVDSAIDAGLGVRIFLVLVVFAAAVVLTHVVMVYVVTAWVIPRLKPNSYWAREVDSYMASSFPGRWGKPAGVAEARHGESDPSAWNEG